MQLRPCRTGSTVRLNIIPHVMKNLFLFLSLTTLHTEEPCACHTFIEAYYSSRQRGPVSIWNYILNHNFSIIYFRIPRLRREHVSVILDAHSKALKPQVKILCYLKSLWGEGGTPSIKTPWRPSPTHFCDRTVQGGDWEGLD